MSVALNSSFYAKMRFDISRASLVLTMPVLFLQGLYFSLNFFGFDQTKKKTWYVNILFFLYSTLSMMTDP